MTALLVFVAASSGAYAAAAHWGTGLLPNVDRRSPTALTGLPDILEGLSLCTEAGMDLLHALAMLLEPRKDEPLAAELYRVVQEVKAGATKADAWRRLAERIEHEEIKLLVALVLQGEALGTGLSRALRNLSEGMRERRFRAAEKRALEAPVRLMLPMMCVFVAIFLVIGGALYLDMQQGGGY